MGVVVDYKIKAKEGVPGRIRKGLDLQLGAYLLYVRDVLRWIPAGGLYVPVLTPPVREDKAKPGTMNPLDIRMHGIFLRQEREAIDGGTEMLTDRPPQQLSTGREMDELLDVTRTYLRRYATTWRSGWISSEPLQDAGRLPCRYCEYNSVCRFRPGRDRVRLAAEEGMQP